MTKHDTIREIRRLNPTADSNFLERFSDKDLEKYLQRLWETGQGSEARGTRSAARR